MLNKVVHRWVRYAAHVVFLTANLALPVGYSALAANVTLAWDPSPDTNVVGYNVYYGTASRTYTSMVSAGSATTVTVSNLTEGATYYFAATAYDSWGLESDYSAEVTYTVPFPVVNYAPTLDAISNKSLAENAGQQTVTLTGITSGSASEAQTLVVTATSSNPSLIPNPSVSYSSPNTTGTISFTPAAYAYGSATISVTVNDGGSTNNTITRTFQVSVASVNQAPTLAVLNDLTILEDSAQVVVNLTGIGTGAPNESQTLAVTASSSNTGLIPTPTVSYTSPQSTGSLTLQPAATKSGSAVITVTVNDGGFSNNIVSRTFTVTVTPVNDPPTINALTDASINRGAGTQTVALSGIGSGAANESQTLSVTAISSNPGLIPNPTITYSSPSSTGTLRFTPSSGVGSALITVTVSDGGSENSTKSVSFTVIVNDPPAISDIPHQAIALGSNMPPVSFSIGDLETSASSLTVTATSSNPLLVPNSNIALSGSGANRTIAITPLAGKVGITTITVTVSDGIGSASDTFQLAVQQRPSAPGNLHLVIEGGGQVLGASQSMVVGQTYTLTAVPDIGQEFAGWTGTVTSSSTRITFVAETNMDFKATFVPSPFIPTKGIYTGLFYEGDSVRQESSGYFAFLSNSRGKYSGYLLMGTKRYPFSGRFDLKCMATNQIPRSGGTPLTLRLALGPEGTDLVSGEVADGTWIASLSGDRATFHAVTNKAQWAGRYTLVLPGQDADPSLPTGDSYGIMKVSASGTASVMGRLADGTPFVRTARMSRNGALPVYIPLYGGKGSLLSWTVVEDRETDDVHGDVQWIRPAGATAISYPAGFSYLSSLTGSAYTYPTVDGTIISPANSTVRFNVDGREFSNAIELGSTGLVKNLGSNRMRMSVVPGTGTFKGAIIDPETGNAVPFAGSLLQNQNTACGFFKSGTSFGRVTID